MFKNMFKSGCLARTAHVILTWLTTLVLFLHNTDLRKCQEQGDLLHPVMFSALVLLSVLLYFTVSLMDPGFVLSDSDTKGTSVDGDEELEEMIPQEQSSLKQRRCGYCFLLQPMRARHCRTCKRCVRRFDHHCPWIDNCVGERNHRWFLLYLCVQFAAVSWGLQTAWSGVVFAPTWQQWFSQNGFLLGAIGVTGVFSVVVFILLCIHLYLASANTTTWEFMSRHRILYLKHCDSEENPFDRGVICNLWDFFCVCYESFVKIPPFLWRFHAPPRLPCHRPIRGQLRRPTSSSAGCSGRGGVDFSSSCGARSVRKRARENLRCCKFVCGAARAHSFLFLSYHSLQKQTSRRTIFYLNEFKIRLILTENSSLRDQ